MTKNEIKIAKSVVTEIFNGRIILFNTMNIPYRIVDFGQIVHFGGTNGYGKTSFLRVGAYPFVGPDNLGIESRQKSFRQYYFPDPKENGGERPYIVYEYRRRKTLPDGTVTDSFFIVVTYLPSGSSNLHYFFADMPFEASHFFDESGRVKSRWQDVVSSIKEALENDKSRYCDVSSHEALRCILFGCYSFSMDRKDNHVEMSANELYKFAIFRFKNGTRNIGTAMKRICSAIAKIMLPYDKVGITTMNDVLESLLPDANNQSFNYADHKKSLADFSNRLSAFEEWNSSRCKNNCGQILSAYPEVEHLDAQLMEQYSALKYAYMVAKSECDAAKKQLEMLQTSLKDKKKEIDDENTSYNTRHDDIVKAIGATESAIKEIEKTYKALLPFIEKKDLYKELPSKQAERSILSERLKSLNEDIGALAENHDKTAKAIAKIYDDYIENVFNRQVAENQTRYEKQCLQADKEAGAAKDKIDTDKSEARNALYRERGDLKIELDRNKLKLQKVFTEYNPLSSQIKEQEKIASAAKTAKESATASIKTLTREERSLQEEMGRLSSIADQMFDTKIGIADETVEKDKKEIASAEKRLARYDESFAGWLTMNVPDWEKGIGQVVRDELLDLPSLNPALRDADSETVMGVHIDLPDSNFEVKSRDAIENSIEKAKETLQKDMDAADALRNEKDRWLQNEKEVKEKKLAETRISISEERQKESDEKAKFESANSAITKLQEENKVLQNKKFEELKKEESSLTERLNLKEAEVNNFDENVKKEKDALDAVAAEKKKTFEDDWFAANKALEAERVVKETQRNEALKEEERLYKARMEEKADVSGEISELNDKIAVLDAFINPLVEADGEGIWKHTVSPFLENTLPLLEPSKAELENSRQELSRFEDNHKSTIKALEKSVGSIETAITNKMASIATFHENVLYMEGGTDANGNIITPYLSVVEETYELCPALETTRSCREIIETANNINRQKSDKIMRLKGNVDSILNNLGPAEKRFLFGEDKQFTERTSMEDVKWMFDYIRDNKVETLHKYANTDIALFIRSMIEIGNNWNSYIKEAKTFARELNEEFEKTNFIPSVKNIVVKVEPSNNSYATFFERIRERFADMTDLTAIDFFAKQNSGIIRFIREAARQAEDNPAGEVRAINAIICQFRVDENNKLGTWESNFSSPGSEGIKYLVKNMFFVVVLRRLTEKYLNPGFTYRFPIWIDEVGKLYPGYLEKYMLNVITNGFNVYTVSPVESRDVDPTIFYCQYMFVKDEETGTTNIIPIAREEADMEGMYFNDEEPAEEAVEHSDHEES